jgi:hypothetical protein
MPDENWCFRFQQTDDLGVNNPVHWKALEGFECCNSFPDVLAIEPVDHARGSPALIKPNLKPGDSWLTVLRRRWFCRGNVRRDCINRHCPADQHIESGGCYSVRCLQFLILCE